MLLLLKEIGKFGGETSFWRGNWGWGKDDYFSLGHIVFSGEPLCLISVGVPSSLLT